MPHMKRAVLDVDPSIIERNLLTVSQDDEFKIETLLPKKEEKTPSKMIRPSPGFCVKARTLEDEKIFINVCQTDHIPPPEDISEGQLLEILSSETPSEFRVPMSIGEGRPVNDKSGQPATAYDIAINKIFLDKMELNDIFKQFFLNVVFEGLEDKYKIQINMEKFCILKNRKVMGELQLHCIKDKEMMQKMGKKEKKLIEVIEEKKDMKKVPPYRVVMDKVNGTEMIIADMFMPDLLSVNNVQVLVGDDRLVIESQKSNYFLDIFFPIVVKWKISQAEYNKNTGFLTVTMPIMQYEDLE